MVEFETTDGPVGRQLKAYNQRAIELFCDQFTDDIEVYSLPGNTLDVKGMPGFKERYHQAFTKAPLLRCVVLQRIRHGKFVIDHEELRREPGHEPFYAVAIYELTPEIHGNQKICRVWFPMA